MWRTNESHPAPPNSTATASDRSSLFPEVKNRCRYEFMLLPEERPEVIEDTDFVNRLLQEFRPSTTRTVRRCKVYVAQRRVAETFNRGRVLIAGDSAHLMPPFAGQGLNSGFRDAANLVWKLAEVVHGTASPKLLNTYHSRTC